MRAEAVRWFLLPLLLEAPLAAQPPGGIPRLDTLSLQPITEQPLVGMISGLSEIGSFWTKGGHAALRTLILPGSSSSGPYLQRVFILLRPMAHSGQPIVFELPQVEGARIQHTATDQVNHWFLVEYSRDNAIVRRQRVRVVDPEHIFVEDEILRSS